ncbi:TniQ family protein [Deinococcus sp.]|uniref:TniQ family protein n=1 Tax=Deinococcus sp. TaxID=47478 RepID=UPI0025E50987|nr:TniQ family protein [Deinococcus sp.]
MTGARLPRRPRPEAGESLSSWLVRLAHANVLRLTYLSHYLTGDHNFWKNDPDRHLRDEMFSSLTRATGVSEADLRDLMLPRFAGLLFDRLHPRAGSRWVLPYAKRFYEHQRCGAVIGRRIRLESLAAYDRNTHWMVQPQPFPGNSGQILGNRPGVHQRPRGA